MSLIFKFLQLLLNLNYISKNLISFFWYYTNKHNEHLLFTFLFYFMKNHMMVTEN